MFNSPDTMMNVLPYSNDSATTRPSPSPATRRDQIGQAVAEIGERGQEHQGLTESKRKQPSSERQPEGEHHRDGDQEHHALLTAREPDMPAPRHDPAQRRCRQRLVHVPAGVGRRGCRGYASSPRITRLATHVTATPKGTPAAARSSPIDGIQPAISAANEIPVGTAAATTTHPQPRGRLAGPAEPGVRPGGPTSRRRRTPAASTPAAAPRYNPLHRAHTGICTPPGWNDRSERW